MSRLSAASGLILVCGVHLVQTSDSLARQTSLGHLFVGATLLAATTSLPEVSTMIVAVRLRAYTIAISNIFGSNLIMIILLLPADITYRPGPVLAEADASAEFAIVFGIMLTIVYLIGLLNRSQQTVHGIGLDSLQVIALYFATIAGLFVFR